MRCVSLNKSVISESFGEQLTAITTGTPFEINADSDSFIGESEHQIRKVMFSLWMDAQSYKLAKHLEEKISGHFEQLYEFSFGVSKYDKDYSMSKDTETLALRIIDEKNRYSKQIEHLRERYKRFKRICDQLNVEDKQLIVSYFERSHKVEYEALRNVLRRHLKGMESIYKEDELQAELEAETEEDEYQEDLGKQKYKINMKYVYMTPVEYAEYQENEKKRNQKLYERLGLSI